VSGKLGVNFGEMVADFCLSFLVWFSVLVFGVFLGCFWGVFALVLTFGCPLVCMLYICFMYAFDML